MNSTLPYTLPWSDSEADVPHATLEVNQACNIRCYACYKDKFSYQKPLEQIQKEIDFILTQRKLASLTIAGGEPTLYPQLAEVISYIRAKQVRPILLTNGTLLDDSLLQRLQQAGLKKVMIHIDSRQVNRPDLKISNPTEKDLIPLRQSYTDMALRARLEVNYAVTLYRDRLDEFTVFMKECQKNPAIGAVLITDYSNFLNYSENTADDGLSLHNKEVWDYMQRTEGTRPTWYVPSTKSLKELQWLLYAGSFTVSPVGETTALHFQHGSSAFFRLIPRIPKWLKGRYSFDDPTTTTQKTVVVALYGLLSCCPSTLLKTAKFLWAARKNGNLKLLTMVFQQAPRKLSNGEYETCLNCPDATVRNFKMMPLCLADKIDGISK